MRLKLNNSLFRELATKIHNNKYNYDIVNYVNVRTKVNIKCPEHGFFSQYPRDHLKGRGCIKCSRKIQKVMNTEDFIKYAKLIHGEKYNYDQTVFVEYHHDVVIHCKKHEKFTQEASLHLRGFGCPKCSEEKYVPYMVLFNKSNDNSKPIEASISKFRHYKKCGRYRKLGYSQKILEWFKNIEVLRGVTIQHAASPEGKKILDFAAQGITSSVCQNPLKLQGFDGETVYESYNCYMDGCPDCFPNRTQVNAINHRTNEENYKMVLERIRIIKECRLELIYAWQHEICTQFKVNKGLTEWSLKK